MLPDSLKQSIYALGGPNLEKKMKVVHENSSELSKLMYQPLKLKNNVFRKISIFSDKEGKTRTIALGDYWSQTALQPFTWYLYKMLRCIPNDQTFDQSKGLSDLSFEETKTFYSYDLSAFTDRFPVIFEI